MTKMLVSYVKSTKRCIAKIFLFYTTPPPHAAVKQFIGAYRHWPSPVRLKGYTNLQRHHRAIEVARKKLGVLKQVFFWHH